MRYSIASLEMAERHVREGREHVRKQAALLALLADPRLRAQAVALLRVFRETQAIHEAHLARILEERPAPSENQN